jgi:putative endonuclease
MERTFHVYFMASKSGVLYLGVTSNLPIRVGQHKEKILPGFSKRYNVTKLVWFEPHTRRVGQPSQVADPRSASSF